MSLSDLAEIGSFVSGVAVLASLIYLSRQLTQADRNQQAVIRAARITRIVDIMMANADASLADAATKGQQGTDDLTDLQIRQFVFYAQARFYNAEDSFYQYREKLLNETSFDHVEKGLRQSFALLGFRVIYKRLRSALGKEFVAFADKLLAEVPVAPAFDDIAQWRAELAAERASAGGTMSVAAAS
jgi:hypothetical protein